MMASEAKILQPIVDKSPLFTVMRSCFFKPGKILLVGWNERRPKGDDAVRSEAFPSVRRRFSSAVITFGFFPEHMTRNIPKISPGLIFFKGPF